MRLGDNLEKFTNIHEFAPTNWPYFIPAMRYAEAQVVAKRPNAWVAFVLTVMGESKHTECAAGNLTAAVSTDRLLITDGADMMVDCAIPSSMDGIVMSVSTFGWWVAYVSQRPSRCRSGQHISES